MHSAHIYTHDETVYRVELAPQPDGLWHVTINDRVFTARVVPLAGGGWLLDMDGAQIVVYAARQGAVRHVWDGGETFALSVPDAVAGRRATARPASGSLAAQMPGQVAEVLAQAGDIVARGQTLVILEAMKMEIRVSAPADGIISRVLVRVGDVVERGQTLVEIAAPG
jgi:biotin carboxyl carrier protein